VEICTNLRAICGENKEGGNKKKLQTLRKRCVRCAAAVKKRLLREIFALSYVYGEYFFDHGFAQIMTDLHRLAAEYSKIQKNFAKSPRSWR